MNEYVKSDLYRYCGNTSIKSLIKEYCTNTGFRYMVAHRLVNSTGFEKCIGWVLWIFRSRSKLQIPRKVKIGYGLYIGHGGPIIIHPSTVIGNNCNLAQFTTFGSNRGHAAMVGNNVYIGPNVCVVEDVRIGDYATIGAGSVVTKDIPANATAAGNYAKVLNYNNPGRFVSNVWKVSGQS